MITSNDNLNENTKYVPGKMITLKMITLENYNIQAFKNDNIYTMKNDNILYTQK
jgi:hypothetical protein